MRHLRQPITAPQRVLPRPVETGYGRHSAELVLLALAVSAIFALTGCATGPDKSQQAPPTIDRVVVKKSQRKLELVGNGNVVREYRISLGGSPVGHKYREGDQRTPEGSYVLNWRNPASNYYKAIHISYPSERDRKVSYQLGYNPGGMIMIHGMPNYIQSASMRRQYVGRDWTQGCIAVQNDAMDEIWQLVKDGTPIQIMP